MERMNWNKLMSPLRARGPEEGGRKPSGNDLRSEFEKDYQRIISSASFRRLQDKTQVFPLDKSDFIRTRLTHSLEVANFARSIGRMIGTRIIEGGIDPDFTKETLDDICAVLECAGLLHDIGNPPFGHFGEDAIRDWFKENLDKIDYNGEPISNILSDQQKNDFYKFEGNTQALRVVCKLHSMVDENGMNLTQALLATIMKYPGSSLEINYDKNDPNRDVARKKMGYYYADKEIYNRVIDCCGTYGRRHPLVFALEAADDIAYKTADIEDAVKKRLLDVPTLIKEIEIAMDVAKICDFTDKTSKKKALEQTNKLLTKLSSYYERAKENDNVDPDLYAIQNWIVRVQGAMLGAAVDSFMNNYEAIMEGSFKKELIADTPGNMIMDILGDVAYRYAFISEPILKLEVAADAIFSYLLERLVLALRYYDTPYWKEKSTAVDKKMVGLISSSYMHVYKVYSKECNENDRLYLRMLLATDYVSGMTDSYAKRMYQELKGII